jgi:hypothetical protein
MNKLLFAFPLFYVSFFETVTNYLLIKRLYTMAQKSIARYAKVRILIKLTMMQLFYQETRRDRWKKT